MIYNIGTLMVHKCYPYHPMWHTPLLPLLCGTAVEMGMRETEVE